MLARRLASFVAGRRAERRARRALRRAGFVIVERNVRVGRDEIDLVAVDGETLVFVEVKARLDSLDQAILACDAAKLARLRRAARRYRAREGLREIPWRIDLVALSGLRFVHLRDI